MNYSNLVDFYFDFTSPYSYLAWESLLEDKSIELNPIPVMVGKVISEVGSIGPGEVKPKREFLFKDCLRKAQKMGISLRAPATLPFNPLGLLRFIISLSEDKELQSKAITSIFRYGWRDGKNYDDYEALKEFIIQDTGMSPEQYDEFDSNRLARKIIKSNISDAVGAGVFGVPSLKIEDEVFWGLDSLDDVRAKLNNNEIDINLEFNRFVKILEGEANA